MNYTEFENALKNVVRVCYGDDNDLIRRGDALNAIREVCRIGCLPSSALTRKEQREVVILDAVQAVSTVKKAAVPTVDPESLRPTAHWRKRIRVFRLPSKRMENKRKSYEVLHVLRRKDGERRPGGPL